MKKMFFKLHSSNFFLYVTQDSEDEIIESSSDDEDDNILDFDEVCEILDPFFLHVPCY